MSREHLYKAKRINWKELPKEKWWVEGYYFCMTHTDGRHSHHFIIPLGADLSLGTPIEKIQVEIDPDTLCEYTGLTDKSGRKIFDRNIIDSDGTIGIVKFGKYNNEFHYGFYIEWPKCPLLRQELSFWNTSSEIVGNIFDNPELIKGRREDTYGKME